MSRALKLILITSVVSAVLLAIAVSLSVAIYEITDINGTLTYVLSTVLVTYLTVFAVYFKKTHLVSKCTRHNHVEAVVAPAVVVAQHKVAVKAKDKPKSKK